MHFIKWLFWPLDQIDSRLERRWYRAECSRFDELRGFSLDDIHDIEDQEAQWAINTRVQPAES